MHLSSAFSKRPNDDPIRILSQMIKEHPESAVAHAGLATIYTQLNRWEEATKEFQEALHLNPQDDVSRISYAKVLILLSNFKSAFPVVHDYRQRHPERVRWSLSDGGN